MRFRLTHLARCYWSDEMSWSTELYCFLTLCFRVTHLARRYRGDVMSSCMELYCLLTCVSECYNERDVTGVTRWAPVWNSTALWHVFQSGTFNETLLGWRDELVYGTLLLSIRQHWNLPSMSSWVLSGCRTRCPVTWSQLRHQTTTVSARIYRRWSEIKIPENIRFYRHFRW